MRRVLMATVVLALVLGFVYWLTLYRSEKGRSMDIAEAARSRVHRGMTLAEAELQLGDAWHHAECSFVQRDKRDSLHLYLFGSHDLDDTGIVYLRAEGPANDSSAERQVITSVSGLENYELFQFDACSDLDFGSVNGDGMKKREGFRP